MGIFSIFTGLFSLVGNWVTGRQQIAQAKQQTELAVEQQKAKLALDDENNNAHWELAELADADKFTKRISFCMFTAPFFVAIFNPQAVQHYFTVGLGSMPQWFVTAYVSITGAIWGISELKNSIPSLVQGTLRAAGKRSVVTKINRDSKESKLAPVVDAIENAVEGS